MSNKAQTILIELYSSIALRVQRSIFCGESLSLYIYCGSRFLYVSYLLRQLPESRQACIQYISF
ncbi:MULTISPECIES: hypothetical protein [Candidatus Ichthyocystis]|uniref:hypothetical protein n=1 Tax=Candidatus Ichthyocystis TaxID=2929841 RepID=UPI001146AF7D|nr:MULTISPECIES: hypothetical protein [Ichthyocystis]